MFQPLSLFIGYRYSRTSKKNSFISFITFFSMAGIALGVLSLIVVVSVMNGFEAQLKDKILGVVPQIIISSNSRENARQLADWQPMLEPLQKHPQINQVQPYVQSQALIQSTTAIEGVMLQGIYQNHYAPVQDMIIQGRWADLYRQKYGVVIGQYLASRLRIGVGEPIRIMVAGSSNYTPLGRMPRQRLFTVVGIFNTGSEVDDQVIFTSGKAGAKMLKLKAGNISGIRLYLQDAFQAPQISAQLAERYPDHQLVDWRQSYGKLFAAVKMEKAMMWIMLTLIIAVAAFNIVSALVMMVTEKQAEVAILKTQGLTDLQGQQIFIVQGLYNGMLGSLIGTLLGIILSYSINPVLSLLEINLIGSGYNNIPILVKFQEVMMISLGAILLSFLATIYPAYKAAIINPVEVLRYE